MNILKTLQQRWKLKSITKTILVLLVFALTGTTVILLKRVFPESLNDSTLFNVLYYILVLPVYQVLLLLFGFLLGQYKFFVKYEMKMINRIKRAFTKKQHE